MFKQRAMNTNATRLHVKKFKVMIRRHFTSGNLNLAIHTMWPPLPPSLEVKNIELSQATSWDAVPWQPVSVEILQTTLMSCQMNFVGICRTDTESDMEVKTTAAVCEYYRAPTTRLYTPQDYVLNTDVTLLSFPTFLGPPQMILCRNND